MKSKFRINVVKDDFDESESSIWERLGEVLKNEFVEQNMTSKLEDMVALWEDKFSHHIDEYEDMYYILNPTAKKPKDAKSDTALFNIKNISILFKRTDAAYREGYLTAVITKLQVETYNRRTPAIRLNVFYLKERLENDNEES